MVDFFDTVGNRIDTVCHFIQLILHVGKAAKASIEFAKAFVRPLFGLKNLSTKLTGRIGELDINFVLEFGASTFRFNGHLIETLHQEFGLFSLAVYGGVSLFEERQSV